MGSAVNIGDVGLAAQAFGAASSVVGAYTSANASRDAYEAQAAVERANAQYADMQAHDAVQRGYVDEFNTRLKGAQFASSQRARLAANGIDINQGSAAGVLDSTDLLTNIDAATVRQNATREAAGFIRQRNNDYLNSGLLDGRAGSENPLLSAASTLLTSGGQVAASWYKLNAETSGTPKKSGKQ